MKQASTVAVDNPKISLREGPKAVMIIQSDRRERVVVDAHLDEPLGDLRQPAPRGRLDWGGAGFTSFRFRLRAMGETANGNPIK